MNKVPVLFLVFVVFVFFVGDMYIYQGGDAMIAFGQVQRMWTTLHGCPIPPDHICELAAVSLVLGEVSTKWPIFCILRVPDLSRYILKKKLKFVSENWIA